MPSAGRLSNPNADRVDIRDRATVDTRFAQVRPACVIHTAYSEYGPAAYATTVEGSVNVARAANANGARLIHLSTDVVFDGRGGAPYRESDPLSPITTYGRHAEAEQAVAAAPRTRDDRAHLVDLRRAAAVAARADSPGRGCRRCVAGVLHRRAALPGGGVRPGGGTARAGRLDLRRDPAHRRCRRGVPVGVRQPGNGRRSASDGFAAPIAPIPGRSTVGSTPRSPRRFWPRHLAACARCSGSEPLDDPAPCSMRYRKRSCRRRRPCCQNSYRSGTSR